MATYADLRKEPRSITVSFDSVKGYVVKWVGVWQAQELRQAFHIAQRGYGKHQASVRQKLAIENAPKVVKPSAGSTLKEALAKPKPENTDAGTESK